MRAMTTPPQDPKMPDSKMIAAANRLAKFIASPDETQLQNIFADSDVTIIENFAPFVFKGRDAIHAWSQRLRSHVENITDLMHAFGATHDFSADGDKVFFTIKTKWSGKTDGVPFKEEGGWSFVLIRQADDWRVQSYGWSVTDITLGELEDS